MTPARPAPPTSAGVAPADVTPTGVTPAGATPVQLVPSGDAALAAAVDQGVAEAADAGVTQSVAVVDRATAEFVATPNADTTVLAMSTVKLMIASSLYARYSGTLPSDITADMASMLQASNNDAASRLFDLAGGQAAMTAVFDRYGLTDSVATPRWGSSETSAIDLARLLTAIDDDPRIGPPVFALLRGTTQYAPPGAAPPNGSRQWYGVDALDGDRGAKQGFGYAGDGTLLIHSAGYARGRIIVIMSWAAHSNLQAAYDSSDRTARLVDGAA